MSITFMQQVVRISDRFKKDPDSIDRAGQLNQVLIVVVIFHAVMGIYFVKMDEYERKHPRIIHETNLDFELTAPPPAPDFKVGEIPKPITLTEGENPDSGSAAAAKPLEADKVSIPTPKAPETLPVPTPEAARPVVSHKTTVAPPVAVTTTNMVKAAPVNAPKSAPKAPPNTDRAGATSNSVASGAPHEGGGPDGQEGGVGNGGTGSGGEGTGEGDPGTGSGFGNIGGDIATKIGGGTGRAMGNIAPYRKDMLMRIAQNWHPKKKNETMTIQISIGKDGAIISAEILESSGNKRSDKEALAAIEQTEFSPLPEWYKGEQLTFKIDFAKVEALQ
ncbi:MAG: TonB family protein [Candidatus Obscuribacterales bacterium]|jgi:TonB family protein|nr:TonB family protein [Candidatus Obscuribacterales bacterium]